MDLESNAREETPEESPAHLTAETERKAWCTLGAFYCLFGTVGFLNWYVVAVLRYTHRGFMKIADPNRLQCKLLPIYLPAQDTSKLHALSAIMDIVCPESFYLGIWSALWSID